VCGGLPFLIYQIQSRGGTLEAVGMFQAPGSWGERIGVRLLQFSEILLADREHRAMWNGPETPEWQVWVFPAMVFAALFVCVFAGRAPLRGRGRAVAAMFLVLAALLFTSRMAVSEHHLIVLVPVAAAVVAAAAEILRARFAWFWIPAAAAGVLYAGSALNWHRLALEGLERTGGMSVWSDGIYTLAGHLEQNAGSREIKILDWGLQNNLFVLTRGRLRTREIFGDATERASGSGKAWREEIHSGGVFVLYAEANRQFPVASQAFLDAVKRTGVSARRSVVRDKSGALWVEIYEIEPGGAATEPGGAAADLPAVSRISMADPGAAPYIEGFHQIEDSAWRWTRRQFSASLTVPAGTAARVRMKIFVPAAVVDRLGPVTLRANYGAAEAGRATYSKSGAYEFVAQLPAAKPAGAVRIDFSLDKALAPTAGEGRELGIIVHSIELAGLSQ
jgi:hypothetical protein